MGNLGGRPAKAEKAKKAPSDKRGLAERSEVWGRIPAAAEQN